MIGGREAPSVPEAIAPRGESERALGSNMYRLWPEQFELARESRRRPHGHANFGVARAGHGTEVARRGDHHLVAESHEPRGGLRQCLALVLAAGDRLPEPWTIGALHEQHVEIRGVNDHEYGDGDLVGQFNRLWLQIKSHRQDAETAKKIENEACTRSIVAADNVITKLKDTIESIDKYLVFLIHEECQALHAKIKNVYFDQFKDEAIESILKRVE